METVTISKSEYEYLKQIEAVAKDELLISIKKGLKEASEGKIKER